MQPHSSGLVFELLKAGCSVSWTLFKHGGIVSVIEVCEMLISDMYSTITIAAAEDPVNGMAEESRDQYEKYHGLCHK